MYQLKKFIFQGRKLDYVIDFPNNYSSEKRYPILFYLHGYGFVGKDVEALSASCPMQRERVPETYEFILVAPLCDKISWLVQFEFLSAFIDDVVARDYCDRNRVYLSGSSMGGYTAWVVLLAKKEIFAGAVICCGGGQYWAAGVGAYNGIPLKIVHGAQDRTVYPRESELMYEAIVANGGTAELAIYDDLAHDVWTRTFTDRKTYDWLMEQSKSKEKDKR